VTVFWKQYFSVIFIPIEMDLIVSKIFWKYSWGVAIVVNLIRLPCRCNGIMTEQIVIKTWWLLTLALVALTAIGSMLTAYCGLFDLIALRWSNAGSCALASFIMGGGSYLLCRYRGDLVGD
jgi:hypothetical protein